jgi:nucleotide-binding universal stress UspA family protein
MKNMLALIDLTPLGEVVVNHAATLAKGTGAKLWILHVAAPEPDFVGFETGPQHVRDHRASTLRTEHRYLQDMRDQLQALGVNAEALLVQGSTVESVFLEVERLHIDLIAVGSRGHSGLYKILMGSMSEQVLKRAQVPVLVVPGGEE